MGVFPFVWKQLKTSSRGSKSHRHNNPLFDHLTVTITHIAHKPCVYVPQIAFIFFPPLVLFQKALSWKEHKLQVTRSLRWVILMLWQFFLFLWILYMHFSPQKILLQHYQCVRECIWGIILILKLVASDIAVFRLYLSTEETRRRKSYFDVLCWYNFDWF